MQSAWVPLKAGHKFFCVCAFGLLLPGLRMTGWRWCSLSQRSLTPELHPSRDSSLAQHLGCVYTLFMVAPDLFGSCWKPPATRTVPGMYPELTSPAKSQVWLMQLCRLQSVQCRMSLIPLLRHCSFPSPVNAVLCCWATTAPCLTWEQFYFQELKSWTALEVLPPGQLCRSPWRNPPSPGAAKQEPRTVGQLLCHPTAQRAPGWALGQQPQALARRTPRAKLKISTELMRIHRLLLCGKTERKSHPWASFLQHLRHELSRDPSCTLQWPSPWQGSGTGSSLSCLSGWQWQGAAPAWQVTAQAPFDQVCHHLKHQGRAWSHLQESLSVTNLKASLQIIVL